MEKMDKEFKQELAFFESLTGDDKKNYFVMYFVSELVFALKDKRKQNKLTQNELAKIMGVKQAYISKIENLQKIPTLETIGKYLYALDFSISDVFEINNVLTSGYNSLPTISFVDVVDNKSDDIVYENVNNKNKCKLRLA